MANKTLLSVEKREATGKQVAKLRRDDLVPAVIYGREFEPTNVQFSQNEARRVVREAGTHTPVELSLDGKKSTALIKSIDYAPARADITHISFQAVRADEVVTTEVPLVLINEAESAAAKAGLIILPTLEEVEIRAKVSELPEKIEIDATNLAVSEDKLTLADAKLPTGVEIVDYNPEIVIASVWEPAALEAKNAAADKAADEARAKEAEAAATEESTPETPAETAPSEPGEGNEKPAESAE
ncbi:50S ribosomal protein L25 [Candidatus Saccharibacteria bacterium]|nr:50S ribosomal protein L25 [Candidatus Saccharibacteria bacterium]